MSWGISKEILCVGASAVLDGPLLEIKRGKIGPFSFLILLGLLSSKVKNIYIWFSSS